MAAVLMYTSGVQWVPINVASILAKLELAVASLFGYVLFGERLSRPNGWAQA